MSEDIILNHKQLLTILASIHDSESYCFIAETAFIEKALFSTLNREINGISTSFLQLEIFK